MVVGGRNAGKRLARVVLGVASGVWKSKKGGTRVTVEKGAEL